MCLRVFCSANVEHWTTMQNVFILSFFTPDFLASLQQIIREISRTWRIWLILWSTNQTTNDKAASSDFIAANQTRLMLSDFSGVIRSYDKITQQKSPMYGRLNSIVNMRSIGILQNKQNRVTITAWLQAITGSDVTKLVKICIRRMRIVAFTL